MPKKARPIDEIKKYKKHILDTTVELIIKKGYSNFSMRKLAEKLGVSATAIYGYYPNKESLYLNVLIEGFKDLTARLVKARDSESTPSKQFIAITHAYIEFGIKRANLYNVMLISNVPKYYDFIGKPAEELARHELECAMEMREVAINSIKACEGILYEKGKPEKSAILEIMCAIHGFISFYNSQVTNYLPDSESCNDLNILIDNFINSLFI